MTTTFKTGKGKSNLLAHSAVFITFQKQGTVL